MFLEEVGSEEPPGTGWVSGVMPLTPISCYLAKKPRSCSGRESGPSYSRTTSQDQRWGHLPLQGEGRSTRRRKTPSPPGLPGVCSERSECRGDMSDVPGSETSERLREN